MNNVQLKHFRLLLAKKKNNLLDAFYYNKEKAKPKAVLEAERVVQAWKDEQRAIQDKVYAQINEAVLELETRCIFDAENKGIIDALSELDRWEPKL